MQLKHFEHLANLERSIIKQQFQRAARAPTTRQYGAKPLPANKPQVIPLSSVTGDQKLKNPYTAGPTRKYPKNPTEKEIREQKRKNGGVGR